MKYIPVVLLFLSIILTAACTSRSDSDQTWMVFTMPNLPVLTSPRIPDRVPQSARVFDRSHISEINAIVSMLTRALASPRQLCSGNTSELRFAVMSRMGATDPLMDQSWALPKLKRVLDMLTMTYRALGCPDSPPDSAVLDDARMHLNTVRAYLKSL